MVAEEARIKNAHQTAANNRESLKRRMQRTDEEALLAEKSVREIGARRETADAELAQLKNEIRELEGRIGDIKGELDESIKALSVQVKTTQTLEMERSKTHSSLSALKKMEANLDWYKDGVKAVFKAAGGENAMGDGGGSLQGVVGLLADVIEPADGWETLLKPRWGNPCSTSWWTIIVPAPLPSIIFRAPRPAGAVSSL